MSSDPYVSNVSTLLHFESPVENITGGSITLNNGASISTAQYKFGTSSLSCNGASQYARLPASTATAFGTGAFTIECWVRFNTVANAAFMRSQSGSNGFWLGYFGGQISFYCYNDNSNFKVNWTPSAGVWYAVAAERDASNVVRLYIDGVMVLKYSGWTVNLSASTAISMGSSLPDANSDHLDGYIDEVRITKGVGRYASDSGYTVATDMFVSQFSMTSSDLTTVKSFGFWVPETAQPQDPYFPSTTVLLHGTTPYNEANGTTGSYINGASSSGVVSKFGGASFAFNGSSQYVYFAPANNIYTFGSGEFTVECWVRFNSVVNSTFILARNSGFIFDYESGKLRFFCFNDNSNFNVAWTPSVDVWYAVAAERDANNVMRLYIDGRMVLKYSGWTANMSGTSTYLSIGSFLPDTNANHMNGYIDEVRITKAARYATDFGYTVATREFYPTTTAIQVDATAISSPVFRYIGASVLNSYRVSDGSIIIDPFELADGVAVNTVTGAIIPIQRFVDEYAEYLESLKLDYGTLIAQVIGMSDPLIVAHAVTALDQFYGRDVSGAAAKYTVALPDGVRAQDLTRLGQPVGLSDTIGTSETTKIVQALRIAEVLRLNEIVAAGANYRVSIFDAVKWADALRRFFAGDAVDGIGFVTTVAPQYRPTATLTQGVGISQSESSKLVFRVIADDTVDLTDTELLKMIFAPAVAEGIEISAAYVAPNGNLTTWAVNTETGAVTEYTNYGFNSFAQIGHKYLGAASDGLYELNGDDDAGEDIISVIKSGLAQFGGSRFTMFKAAYMGVRGGGEYVLRLETGDGRYYDYNVIAQDMQTTKVRLGKGLRARYFSFELTSTGQDFDLDSVEFVPLVAQRRV